MNIDKYVKRELKKIANCLNKRKIEKDWTIEIPLPVYHIIKPFLSEHLHCQVITEHLDKSQWTDAEGYEHKMNRIRLIIDDSFMVQCYDYSRPLLTKYINYFNLGFNDEISFEEYLNESIVKDCLNSLTSTYSVAYENLKPEFITTSTLCVLLYTLYSENKADHNKTIKQYSKMRGWSFKTDTFKELIHPEIDKIRMIAKYNTNVELFEYDYIYKTSLNTYNIRVSCDNNGRNRFDEYNHPTVSVTSTPNESPLTYEDIKLTDDGLQVLEMKYFDDKNYVELDEKFLYHVALMSTQELNEYIETYGNEEQI
ncbi:hypothetical protein [Pseudomonas sp. NBRC 111118]|uniref:hypothetical protein n=1 Tax=Pseudomonas sp. NBRC 111118 TaxID=1661033 RepID=UPI000B11D650|nr:hypothetical protein [Pseudomonas sp. NBRC 111118]